MDKVKSYIEKNKDRFLNELFELLRIPSISAQSDHKPDMTRCAEWLAASLMKAGADHAEVLPTEGNPVVFAERIVDPKAKTVLVYGHYDVMPVDPVDEWRTSPFEPVVKDGRIWCRGADDDKGQLFMHAKAFEAMCATDSLPCNVKFLLEGEEEIGSPSLYKFCADNKKMLKADIILVSDTSMISMQIPSITCGLRGLTYMEVEVTGPNKDLHSGLFGGAVANPANVLARMVASLIDENGHVTIPGFYDDVRELTAAERKAFNKAPFNLTEYKKALEIGDVEGEAGFTTIERTGIRPSLDVNGIWGGYIEEGTKTVIPSKASAKISMRLVPGQDFKKIAKLFEKHFKAIAPKSVKVDEGKVAIDGALLRTDKILDAPVFDKYHSETEMMRYIKRLERRDISLADSMIPLGSCTMKLNAAVEMMPLSLAEFTNIHPFAPASQTEGYLEMIRELEHDLAAIKLHLFRIKITLLAIV